MTSPQPITDLMWAHWKTRLVLAAVELDLCTELAAGPLSRTDIQQRLGLKSGATGDFLDALVAMGVLARAGDRYVNSAESADYLVATNAATYLGDSFLAQGADLAKEIVGLLREGRTLNDITDGREYYDSLYATPDGVRAFQRDMTALSIGSALAMARQFPWTEHKTLVDVGCAEGALPGHVLRAHPHLLATGFDLPQAESGFLGHTAELGVGDRVRFVGGDFFTDELPQGDVIVLGHILHNWDLAEKRMLLDKAYRALPEGGAVIVYETLIDDERADNAIGLILSLIMHLEVPGGFDYTGADCQKWLQEAGFHSTRVEHLDGPESMVIGIR
ncbi:precorrin-6B methylase 2 [Crossiella equi]|uniref:Precorrin-6B methylase 2 n=1 Tax=Crossiella equi TaxID=130796 RepID=A0ABS5APZ9_9PSEU|nr:methyltransferase [Crossiella equi]MBP2478625.1 precorrin-6B methylase 2 [Crossiella equi]